MATTEIGTVPAPQEGAPGPSNVASPSKPKPKNVDIKNGKVVFKQKPVSFDKATETMQETVKFRELLESRVEKSEPPLDVISTEFYPLIAKFVHESDKTATALAKHIHQQLTPETDEDDEDETPSQPPLTLDAVESAIKSVAQRTNYGVDGSNLGLGKAPPAALCVWRWEVASCNWEWLPKASRDKAQSRLAERVQMQKELQSIFDALPHAEQCSMLGIKADAVPKSKLQPLPSVPSIDSVPVLDASNAPPKEKEAPKTPAVNGGEAENGATGETAAKKVGRPKNPETAAKEQERQERKAAKAEKEKKAKEAQAKSQSMMASFFKTKASPPVTLERTPSTPTIPRVSDFDKTFKPFVLKKGSVMAPVNAFRVPIKRRKVEEEGKEVIVIDDEEPVEGGDDEIEVVETPVEVLKPGYKPTLIPGVPPPSSLNARAHGFKTYHPDPVRTLLSRLSEAEVTGDATLVRHLTTALASRTRYPAKVLIFHEDARPGYFGTFTRRSRLIGARTPLVKDDAVLDYGYESGDDWDEEEGGEDVAEGDAEEDEEGSADEDEMDGWLVGDDEEDERAVTPIEEREGFGADPFDMPLPPPPVQKRKAEAGAGGKDKGEERAKKRKVVVPLVPFVKGPCLEGEIGRCEYEPFNQYRIQFFNDSPSPLDPFTFVSQPITIAKNAPAPAPTAQPPTAAPTSVQFVVPTLPAHVASATSSTPTTPSPATSDPTTPKKPKPQPKSAFPDTHLTYLHTKVSQMNTGSLPLLVDAVYQDLKAHKVKKNAIEAKIREVCWKSKVGGGGGSVWSVRPDGNGGAVQAPIQGVVKMEVA
ncbi:unnamed protein product [Peniophora sp. CBMAI 1063]|nr:unnamed protein product [Peniophora sp. CBMAI 1063]